MSKTKVLIVALIFVFAAAVFVVPFMRARLDPDPTPSTESEQPTGIANPFVDVETRKEFEERLGFSVPEIDGKTEIKYTLCEDELGVSFGTVNYSDGTFIRITDTANENLDGIYGGEEFGKVIVGENEFTVMKYSETLFVDITVKGYTVCYYFDENVANYEATISEICNKLK